MDSFVYCYTDLKTDKLYVGVHKGSENDGYISSSKLFLEEYHKRPSDFMRTIINKGTYKDMLILEANILKAANAKNNPAFYNMHNGDGNFYNKQHTEKAKERMRESCKKRQPASIETRRKISQANLGNTKHLGKKHSADSKKLIGERSKGRKLTVESIQKMKNTKKAAPRTVEHLAKLLAVSKGRTWIIENGKRVWKDKK